MPGIWCLPAHAADRVHPLQLKSITHSLAMLFLIANTLNIVLRHFFSFFSEIISAHRRRVLSTSIESNTNPQSRLCAVFFILRRCHNRAGVFSLRRGTRSEERLGKLAQKGWSYNSCSRFSQRQKRNWIYIKIIQLEEKISGLSTGYVRFWYLEYCALWSCVNQSLVQSNHDFLFSLEKRKNSNKLGGGGGDGGGYDGDGDGSDGNCDDDDDIWWWWCLMISSDMIYIWCGLWKI